MPALSCALPLPAADPDKPFPLGWDLGKDRAGFVREEVGGGAGKPGSPGRNAGGRSWKLQVWGLPVPPGARAGVFGDPQALHTHRMWDWVPLLFNSKKLRVFLHLQKPI